jgi:HK97 family phage major capsid protein
MGQILALKEKRAKIIEAMREALRTSDTEAFDKAEAEERELSKQIEREERMLALEKEAVERFAENAEREGRTISVADARSAYNKLLRGHVLNEEERQLLQPEQRTISTTPNTAGGYLIPQEFMNELLVVLKAFGGIYEVSRVVRTSTGAVMPWPKFDGTALKAQIVAENAATTTTTFTFASNQLGAYTYRALAKASREVIQDSAFDLASFVNQQIGEQFGRALSEHFTVGTGTGQPQGVVTGAGLGATAASATALTRQDILNLVHSVDPAYRNSPNCRFMLHDSTLKALKALQLGSGDASPLWQVSMREGEPDRLEGYQYVVNQDVPVIAAAARVIVFGDFSRYVIREVADMTIQPLNELFAVNNQVGWAAFGRWDAIVADNTALKYLRMA